MIEKLMNIDRRIVFILVALAVIIPSLLNVSFPITVSQPTRSTYDYIEAMPPGSTLMIGFNYGPSSFAELHPMAKAVIHHCFRKKIRVIGMTLLAEGATLGDKMLKGVAEETGAVYGEDYVYLGFRPGATQVLLGMGTAIDSVYEADYAKTPLAEIPMMADIKNYEQIDLVLDLASGSSTEWWVIYTNTRYNQQIAAGVTGVIVSQMYPYLQTKQLIGLMPGLLGAAEYEKLIGKPAKGTEGMSIQSFAHLLVVALVILGNIAFFIQRRQSE